MQCHEKLCLLWYVWWGIFNTSVFLFPWTVCCISEHGITYFIVSFWIRSTMPREHRRVSFSSFSCCFPNLQRKPSQVLYKLSNEFYSTLMWKVPFFSVHVCCNVTEVSTRFSVFFQAERDLIFCHKVQRKNLLTKRRVLLQKTPHFLFHKSHYLTKERETFCSLLQE